MKTVTNKRLLALLLSVTMMLSLITIPAAAGGAWDGSIDTAWYNTTDTEFTLTTAAQLAGLAAIVNSLETNGIAQDAFLGKTVKLGANIDLDGKEWTPIGANDAGQTPNAESFKGTFDGQGHTVANILITRASNSGDNNAIDNYRGFFGKVETGAVVRNLGIVSGSITGDRYVGGITGANWGTIENCYNGATITSHGQRGSGGIAGVNYKNNTIGSVPVIKNCYNTGTIHSASSESSSSRGWAGGITAENEGEVRNCYNTGSVTAVASTNFGGLVGRMREASASITNSYTLDTACVNVYNNDLGTFTINGSVATAADFKKTDDDLKAAASLLGEAFKADDAGTPTNNGYPVLTFDTVKWGGGVDPYWYNATGSTFTLTTAAELAGLAAIVNGTAANIVQDQFEGKIVKLGANIDLNSQEWTPIGANNGTTTTPNAMSFKGTFNGQGHTVENILITRTGTGDNVDQDNYNGFFGKVEVGAVVRNLGVISGSITGARFTGGITGANWGTIENCYNGATIKSYGQRGGGGIAGVNYRDNLVGSTPVIRNCYNTGEITGYFTGSSNFGYAGGITSTNEGMVRNCYNIGAIKQTDADDTNSNRNIGGLVGRTAHASSVISDSFMLADTCKDASGIDLPYVVRTAVTLLIDGQDATAQDFVKSASDLKGADVLAILGAGFRAAASGSENNGYPVLTFIEVGPPTLKEISITEQPTFKLYYEGETFIKDGMTVTAKNTENISSAVAEADYTITYQNGSSLTKGDTYVTVSYTEGEVTKEAQVTGLEVVDAVTFSLDAYQLGTADDMRWFSARVNGKDAWNGGVSDLNARLTANITLPSDWTAIGLGNLAPYAGTFDGNGKTLTFNINRTGSTDTYLGAFGYISTGTVKNLTVAGSIASDYSYTDIGGIAGTIDGAGKIENCVNKAELNGVWRVGGIVANVSGGGAVIDKCVNEGNVISSGPHGDWSSRAGGIIAIIQGSTTITNCANRGEITGLTAGGIVGGATRGYTLQDSYNTGSVSATGTSAANDGGGGAVGVVSGSMDTVTISNFYNAGSVAATNGARIGGLAGGVSHTNTSISGYYLEGIDSHNLVDSGSVAGTQTSKTDAQMKDAAFLTELGAEFAADDAGAAINGGYPVLAFETASAPAVTVTVTFNITPADADLSVSDVTNTTEANPAGVGVPADSHVAGTWVFTLTEGNRYVYTVTKSGYTTKTENLTASVTQDISVSLTQIVIGPSTTVYGSETPGHASEYQISSGGTYTVGGGSTGIIEVNTTQAVTLVGTGISDADKFVDLQINCVAGAKLTISNLYIRNNESLDTSQSVPPGKSVINFVSGGNTLDFSGTNLLETMKYVQSAAIHVPPAASLTIGESSSGGTLYIYKTNQGAGIGGNSNEASGTITFADGNVFIKGSQTGALIGGDATSGTNGTITISGGNINLINKARGAAIGASNAGTCAGQVVISGGNVTTISDFRGKAIGSGSSDDGGGTLSVTGGSLKVVRTGNSIIGNGDSSDQTVDDSFIAADKGNLKLLILDESYTNGNSVAISDYGTVYPNHSYKYTESGATISNWGASGDKGVYVYLNTTKNYTITTSSASYSAVWNASDGKWTLSGDSSSSGTGGGGAVEEPEVIGGAPVEADTTVDENGKVTGTVSGESAKSAVDEAIKAVEEAKANGETNVVAEVKLDAKTENPQGVTSAEVTVPVSALRDIAARDDVILTIESDVAVITIDSATLDGAFSGAADGADMKITAEVRDNSTLSEEQKEIVGDNPVLNLSLVVGDTEIHEFGGSVSVSVPYTPPAGFDENDADLMTVYYMDENGDIKEMKGAKYDPAMGTIKFTTTHFSVFFVSEWINPFLDVQKGEWFYKAMRFTYSAGIMNGVSSTAFAPNSNLTRAMLVTMLYRAEGEPAVTQTNPFTDVEVGQWYANAVLWASENGIAEGYGEGIFGPHNSITREQIATILKRYADWKKLDTKNTTELSAYSDAGEISSWAESAMRWANAEGLITGRTETTLVPGGTARRAEVATILQRFIQG